MAALLFNELRELSQVFIIQILLILKKVEKQYQNITWAFENITLSYNYSQTCL